MANKEDAYIHLMQAYASFKQDATPRREIAGLIVDFVKQECAEVDFTGSVDADPEPEDTRISATEEA